MSTFERLRDRRHNLSHMVKFWEEARITSCITSYVSAATNMMAPSTICYWCNRLDLPNILLTSPQNLTAIEIALQLARNTLQFRIEIISLPCRKSQWNDFLLFSTSLKVHVPLIPNGSPLTFDRKTVMLDGMQAIASWSSTVFGKINTTEHSWIIYISKDSVTSKLYYFIIQVLDF